MKDVLKRISRRFGFELRRSSPPSRYLVFEERAAFNNELLKEFANRAALFSKSAERTQDIRNLHLSGLLRPRPQFKQRIEIGGPHTLEIGIWRRADPAAPFVRRRDRRNEWFYWADREDLEPKRSRRRIVLIGESVARGFLYDPHYNPALVLERMLAAALGPGESDVVDLAKSMLDANDLCTLAGQCLALSPDFVVIYAGNNWQLHLGEPEVPCAEALVRTEGAPGLKYFMDRLQEQAVHVLVRKVAGILASRNISVIWIVPESNLGDWADPAREAPLLRGTGNRDWREMRAAAEAALRTSDNGTAEALAQRMTELDGGTTAAPLRILADRARTRGEIDEARHYLELVRDAETWDPSFSFIARTSKTIQNALRQAVPAAGHQLIDLPDVISRMDGGIPGRGLFVDYCHLTSEGMNIAMSEVASRVVEQLTTRPTSPGQFLAHRLTPPDEIEGKAALLAATHNAHFYQSREILHYWCERALRLWPECAEIMTRLVDFQTRRAPLFASKSAMELPKFDRLDTSRYLLRGAKPRMDLLLGDVIAAALRPAGREIGPELDALRLSEHSVEGGARDLTDFYYCCTLPGGAEPAWTTHALPGNRGSRNMYGSAFWPESKYLFFSEGGKPVRLQITYRVPYSVAPGGTLVVQVNGIRVAEHAAGRAWRSADIIVPEQHVVTGRNEVLLVWPERSADHGAMLENAADELLARRLPRFYPVYGEVHSLSAVGT